jgi:hypothetical protein
MLVLVGISNAWGLVAFGMVALGNPFSLVLTVLVLGSIILGLRHLARLEILHHSEFLFHP